MRLRHFVQIAGLALTAAAAPAALAQDPGTAPAGPDLRPEWKGGPAQMPYEANAQAQEQWLAECRRHISARRDDGVGGAVIGGLVGGVAGNRIAGRGDRTIGTVAGAAVGAAAGMAIDKAEDRGRVRDECESYLDSYYAYYAQGGRSYPGYAYPGYGYPGYYPAYGNGYAYSSYGAAGCCQGAPMMMVPAPRREPECTETVEYVYEDVPVRPRARRIPSKRGKIVPDKRIRTN